MKKIGIIVLAILGILLVITAASSVYVVEQDEYALVKKFGRVEEIKDSPNLYFKVPFLESVTTLPKSDQLYDLAASDVITSDKKSMIANCYVIWNISDPLTYYQTLKSISNAEGRTDVMVYNAMKNVISSLTQEEIVQGKDGTLAKTIMQKIGDSGNEYGIEITNVEMKTLDLPSENKDAVYSRMISERNKIAAQYKAEGDAEAKEIRNEVDYQVRVILSAAEKDAKSIIAEGEAEYMKIIEEAYGTKERKEFYEFLRGLDATKASMTEGTMVIIDDQYPIVGNMKSPDKTQMSNGQSVANE